MSARPMMVEALRAAATKDGLWVPIATYLQEYPGETEAAIYTRRSRGVWRDGVECKFIKGAGLWINLLAVNAWAANAKCESRKGSRSDATDPKNPKASESPSSTAASNAANDSG